MSTSETREIAVVNSAHIMGLKAGQARIEAQLDQVEDKVDHLRVSQAKLAGLVAGSGVLGGTAGGLLSQVVGTSVDVPGVSGSVLGGGPLSQVAGTSVPLVSGSVLDVILPILALVLGGAGVALYRRLMGRYRHQDQNTVVEHAQKFRTERYVARRAARKAQLEESLQRPPDDLESLLEEAERLLDRDT